jgi:hypothetical protein
VEFAFREMIMARKCEMILKLSDHAFQELLPINHSSPTAIILSVGIGIKVPVQ